LMRGQVQALSCGSIRGVTCRGWPLVTIDECTEIDCTLMGYGDVGYRKPSKGQ